MSTAPRQPGSFKPWTPDEDNRLVELFKENEDTIEQIAARMGRSGAALRARLGKLRMAGCVPTKRQGTRKRARPGEEPTDTDDVVLAIDMLIDTRIRRYVAGTTHADDEIDKADDRANNALERLEDVLRRWRR